MRTKNNQLIPELWRTTLEKRVPFYDVDAMQVAWHGNYVGYFEEARCQLLDRLGTNYLHQRDLGYGWPIVDLRVKFVRPARFNQDIIIEACIVEWEMRLKIDYLIKDASSGEILTRAYTVQVAIDINTHELLFQTPIEFRNLLGLNSH